MAIFSKNGKVLKVYFKDGSCKYADKFEIASKVDCKNAQCHSTVRFEVGMKTYLQRYEFDINKNKIYYYDLFGSLRSQDDIIEISFVDENDLENYINNDSKTADQIYDLFHGQKDSKTPDPSNGVNHPSHYNQGGIEVWDVIDAFTKDLDGAEAFYAGNIIKYVLRWNHKNGIEDLEKAKVYIDKIIEGRKEK